MPEITASLKMFMNLNIVQALTVKKFDSRLSVHGISMTDFTILFQLSLASDEKLRRTDLADKVGLTASGITRVLSPLEKIGLVRREANSRDARVSYVKLSTAGKRILADACASADEVSEALLTNLKSKKTDELMKLLLELGGTIG